MEAKCQNCAHADNPQCKALVAWVGDLAEKCLMFREQANRDTDDIGMLIEMWR